MLVWTRRKGWKQDIACPEVRLASSLWVRVPVCWLCLRATASWVGSSQLRSRGCSIRAPAYRACAAGPIHPFLNPLRDCSRVRGFEFCPETFHKKVLRESTSGTSLVPCKAGLNGDLLQWSSKSKGGKGAQSVSCPALGSNRKLTPWLL